MIPENVPMEKIKNQRMESVNSNSMKTSMNDTVKRMKLVTNNTVMSALNIFQNSKIIKIKEKGDDDEKCTLAQQTPFYR